MKKNEMMEVTCMKESGDIDGHKLIKTKPCGSKSTGFLYTAKPGLCIYKPGLPK